MPHQCHEPRREHGDQCREAHGTALGEGVHVQAVGVGGQRIASRVEWLAARRAPALERLQVDAPEIVHAHTEPGVRAPGIETDAPDLIAKRKHFML